MPFAVPRGDVVCSRHASLHPARLSIDTVRGLATRSALSRLQLLFRLSNRELATLHAIFLGEKSLVTAGRLEISESTVKSYRKRAYAKLMVENQVEAAICITAVLLE